ncbi:MAG: hypothetical protein WCF84_05895 [Anaerolineae bacterium]
MDEKKDWADARLRGIIEGAKKRRQVYKEIDLSQFDPEMVTPGGEGQHLRVWVNAPSVLARQISEIDFTGAEVVSALAEYLYRPTGEPYTASDLQDLFDAWEGPLRRWLVRQIFVKVGEYVAERNDFLDSSPMDGPSKDNLTNGTSSAAAISSPG